MKQRTQLIVLGGLLVILTGVASYVLVFNKKSSDDSKKKATQSDADLKPELALPTITEAQALANWLAKEPARDTSHGNLVLGLPFAEANPGQPDSVIVPDGRPFTPPPRIEGILWMGTSGSVIIEGEAYSVGQSIPGTDYRVSSMEKNVVVFAGEDGQTLQVELTD